MILLAGLVCAGARANPPVAQTPLTVPSVFGINGITGGVGPVNIRAPLLTEVRGIVFGEGSVLSQMDPVGQAMSGVYNHRAWPANIPLTESRLFPTWSGYSAGEVPALTQIVRQNGGHIIFFTDRLTPERFNAFDPATELWRGQNYTNSEFHEVLSNPANHSHVRWVRNGRLMTAAEIRPWMARYPAPPTSQGVVRHIPLGQASVRAPVPRLAPWVSKLARFGAYFARVGNALTLLDLYAHHPGSSWRQHGQDAIDPIWDHTILGVLGMRQAYWSEIRSQLYAANLSQMDAAFDALQYQQRSSSGGTSSAGGAYSHDAFLRGQMDSAERARLWRRIEESMSRLRREDRDNWRASYIEAIERDYEVLGERPPCAYPFPVP